MIKKQNRKLKKIMSFALASVLILSLVGCAGKSTDKIIDLTQKELVSRNDEMFENNLQEAEILIDDIEGDSEEQDSQNGKTTNKEEKINNLQYNKNKTPNKFVSGNPNKGESSNPSDPKSPNSINNQNSYTPKHPETFIEKLNYAGYQMASRMLSDELEKNNKNAVISPVSIYEALALTSLGADGNTQKEFEKILMSGDYLPKELAEQIMNFNNTLTNNHSDPNIKVANSLWIKNEFPIRRSFLDVATSKFNAKVSNVDFTKKESVDKINEWVLENTNNLLNPNLKPDDVSSPVKTLMSIINTIYYKNTWDEYLFNKNDIKTDKFICDKNKQVDCDYLKTTLLEGKYVDGDGFISSNLRFTDGAKMTFILPDEGKSVEDVLKNTDKLTQAFDDESQQSAKVFYKIPKFKVENHIDLKNSLIQMGMKDTFSSSSANFSNMVDLDEIKKFGLNVYISKVKHGVSFDLNEFGVEAAAYTIVSVSTGGACPEFPEKEVHLNLDRPFIYTVHDKNGSLLFIGVMSNPKA